MTRSRPGWLKALGHREPPATIHIAGKEYRLAHVFKHDSWAATAHYLPVQVPSSLEDGLVCKFNRIQPIMGVPMRWLGRWLAEREASALAQLADLNGIPAPFGPITVDGQTQPHAVAHAFIPGAPLKHDDVVNDLFFPRLARLLKQVHQRGYAYVDLHKRENILVDEQGQPWLIDFQVHFRLASKTLARWPIMQCVLHALQTGDFYHLSKHVQRLRPDQAHVLTDLPRERPWWIRLHRIVAVPLRQLRRQLLTMLGVRSGHGRAATAVFPEEAVRLAQQDTPTSTRRAA